MDVVCIHTVAMKARSSGWRLSTNLSAVVSLGSHARDTIPGRLPACVALDGLRGARLAGALPALAQLPCTAGSTAAPGGTLDAHSCLLVTQAACPAPGEPPSHGALDVRGGLCLACPLGSLQPCVLLESSGQLLLHALLEASLFLAPRLLVSHGAYAFPGKVPGQTKHACQLGIVPTRASRAAPFPNSPQRSRRASFGVGIRLTAGLECVAIRVALLTPGC